MSELVGQAPLFTKFTELAKELGYDPADNQDFRLDDPESDKAFVFQPRDKILFWSIMTRVNEKEVHSVSLILHDSADENYFGTLQVNAVLGEDEKYYSYQEMDILMNGFSLLSREGSKHRTLFSSDKKRVDELVEDEKALLNQAGFLPVASRTERYDMEKTVENFYRAIEAKNFGVDRKSVV